MQLQSHNMKLIPEVTHYDSDGNKIKTISYPSKPIIGDDSNIELTLYEKDGTVKDVFIMPFRSFTSNFGKALAWRVWNTGGNVTLVDTAGTNRSIAAYANLFGYNGIGAVNTYISGIQIGASGSATATSSIDSFKLAGLIANGTGLGSMSYAAQTFDANLTEVSNSYKWSTTRAFTNNSAGNVNVKEVGLVGSTYASAYKILHTRDLVDSNGNAINVTVSPAQVLTVKYNLYIPAASGLSRTVLAILLDEFTNNTAVPLVVSYIYAADYVWSTATSPNVNYNFFMGGGYGINYNGVCVGTGTATESMNIYGNVPSYVSHGVASSSMLLHGSNEYDTPIATYSTSGSAYEWNVKRLFTNGYTNPITVREAMIIVGADGNYIDGLFSRSKWVFARRLIGDQTITSGSSLQVNFKFMIEA